VEGAGGISSISLSLSLSPSLSHTHSLSHSFSHSLSRPARLGYRLRRGRRSPAAGRSRGRAAPGTAAPGGPGPGPRRPRPPPARVRVGSVVTRMTRLASDSGPSWLPGPSYRALVRRLLAPPQRWGRRGACGTGTPGRIRTVWLRPAEWAASLAAQGPTAVILRASTTEPRMISKLVCAGGRGSQRRLGEPGRGEGKEGEAFRAI
jgi:hypothetical protein